MDGIKSLVLKKVNVIATPLKIIPVKNKITLFFWIRVFLQTGQTLLVLTNYMLYLVSGFLHFSKWCTTFKGGK
jgi:hypothetical protein